MSFRGARIRAGLKVQDVMAAMGVSDAAVYCWETGEYNPSVDKLLKLAQLYGCTVDELLRKEDGEK